MTRVELYLKRAAEAEAAAANTPHPMGRMRCLDLAEGWRALAERVAAVSDEPRSWSPISERAASR